MVLLGQFWTLLYINVMTINVQIILSFPLIESLNYCNLEDREFPELDSLGFTCVYLALDDYGLRKINPKKLSLQDLTWPMLLNLKPHLSGHGPDGLSLVGSLFPHLLDCI